MSYAGLTARSHEDSRLVVHLVIELHEAALSDVLNTMAGLPGTTMAVAEPDLSTMDDRLRIVPHARMVFRHGVPVVLTRLEFDLLLFLSRQPNRVLRRSTIMAQVWGIDEPMHSRTVDVHVRRLRDKLGPEHALITTVRGVGYRFDGAAKVVIEPSAVP